LYVLSIPDVKDIVELLDAVWLWIKFIDPPVIEAGKDVIDDKELLLAKSRAMLDPHQCIYFIIIKT